MNVDRPPICDCLFCRALILIGLRVRDVWLERDDEKVAFITEVRWRWQKPAEESEVEDAS